MPAHHECIPPSDRMEDIALLPLLRRCEAVEGLAFSFHGELEQCGSYIREFLKSAHSATRTQARVEALVVGIFLCVNWAFDPARAPNPRRYRRAFQVSWRHWVWARLVVPRRLRRILWGDMPPFFIIVLFLLFSRPPDPICP